MWSIYCVLDAFASQQAKNKENGEQRNCQEEQYLGDTNEGTGGAAEPQDREHRRDDQRYDCKADHDINPFDMKQIRIKRITPPTCSARRSIKVTLTYNFLKARSLLQSNLDSCTETAQPFQR